MLHSLDSPRLAEAMAMERSQNTKHCVLLKSTSQDASKTGMAIEAVRRLLDRADELPGLEIRGLMAMSSCRLAQRGARQFEQVHAKLLRSLQQIRPSTCRTIDGDER
ncbi:MAG: alanine racemase [Pirellulaceae bacterium]